MTDNELPVDDASATTAGERPSRTAPLLLGILIGVLATAVVVLAIALVVADGEDDDETAATTTSAPTTSIAPPTTLPDGDLRGVALRLDVLLEKSARARADVVSTVSQLESGCDLEPGLASTKLYPAEQSRAEVITDLAALQVTGNEEADQIVALLLAAMQDSQHANQHYLAWLNLVYADYYYDNSTYDPATSTMIANCPGPPPKGEDWDLAVAASDDATAAKEEFVAAYGPIAERFGLRNWTADEF